MAERKEEANKVGRTHVWLPDPHALPGTSHERFRNVGRFLADLQPDVIGCIGDLADMVSLCEPERGTIKYEGRRYQLDIEANKEANALLFETIDAENSRRRRNKDRLYRPETHLCYGNHENRINRLISQEPILDGTISLKDLGNENYWANIHNFLEPVCIDGVYFCHYFTSGVMGRPIASIHTAHAINQKHHRSCVAGHLHTRDYAETTTIEGRRIQTAVIGCMFDYYADYAGPQVNPMWWSGVFVMRDVKDGEYDFQFISLKHINEHYGGGWL